MGRGGSCGWGGGGVLNALFNKKWAVIRDSAIQYHINSICFASHLNSLIYGMYCCSDVTKYDSNSLLNKIYDPYSLK